MIWERLVLQVTTGVAMERAGGIYIYMCAYAYTDLHMHTHIQVTKGVAMERAGGKPNLGRVVGFYQCALETEIAYMATRRASDSLWKRY